MKKLTARALLAIAGMMLVPAKVEAQVPVSYTEGDVFLGFRASGGTGASQDLLVNLGPVSQFTTATGPISVDVGGDIAADLAATFGAGWATRSDVFWAVAGSPSNIVTVGSDVSKTLYATKVQSAVGTLNATGWVRQGSTTQGQPSSKMVGMAQAYALTAGVPNTSTVNSTKALIQAKAGTNSYASYQPGGTGTNSGPAPGISFAYFSPTIEGSFASGTAGSVLELYRLVPGTAGSPGELVGLLTLDDAAHLTFVPANGSSASGSGNATVQFQAATYSVSEAGGSVTIKAIRGGNLSSSFTVDFQTADDSAVAGVDFTGASNTVSFAAGQTETTFTVPITDRSGPQGNRSFTVNLSNASAGASIATGSAAVNITETAGDVSFSASSYTVAPTLNGSPATLHISLTRANAAGGSVSVDVSKTGGTILGTELTFTNPTTVSFANGETSKSFDVALNVIPTTLTRTIVFGLTNATGGASIIAPTSATVNVTKKDVTKPVVVITTPASTVATPGTFNLTGTVKEENTPGLSSFTVTFNGTPATPTLGTFVAGTPVAYSVNGLQAENGTNVIVVTAVDASGNTTVATKSFTFSNTTLGTNVAGVYEGLLIPSGTANNDKSGFFTVTFTGAGSFSGKLTVGGITKAFTGLLTNTGVARFNPAPQPSYLHVIDTVEFDSYLGALSFSIPPGGGDVAGQLSTDATGTTALGTITAIKCPYKGGTTPNLVTGAILNQSTKGVYNVAIQHLPAPNGGLGASEFPAGDGPATLTLSNTGSVTFKGYLADGSAFTAAGKLNEDGAAALHVNLYKKQGSFATILTYAPSTDLDWEGSSELWIRPNLPRARYYPNGWPNGISVDSIAAGYVNDAAHHDFNQGADALPTPGNALLVFGTAAPVGVNVNVTTLLVKTVPATGATYTLSIPASTGLYSGTFTSGATKPAYKGVLFNKPGGMLNRGYGYYLTIPAIVSYGATGESASAALNP